MDEILANCLLHMRDDLSQLKRIRDYLDSNPDSLQPGECTVTWKTIEAYNTILTACTVNKGPKTEALDTLLDSFLRIANSNEDSVWNNFGFELGALCSKILSAIEQTDTFDVLFCKFLTVVNSFVRHTSNVWKSVSRQILNVFINKSLSLAYLETGLNLYVSILSYIDDTALSNFAKQNHHLLKTLFGLIRNAGDFEIQKNILEIVFVHVGNDKNVIENFFTKPNTSGKDASRKFEIQNFEEDSRTYLNVLNKGLGPERNVYSINCNRFYLGGCCLKPPEGRASIWLDANVWSRRLSTVCSDFETGSHAQCVIYIQFGDVVNVDVESQPENRFKITIKAKNLRKLHVAATTDEIVCTTTPRNTTESDVNEFKNVLEEAVHAGISRQEKLSQTCDELIVDRDEMIRQENVRQDEEGTTNSPRGINRIIPSALDLLNQVESDMNLGGGKMDLPNLGNEEEERGGQVVTNEENKMTDIILSSPSQNRSNYFECSVTKTVPESNELSLNSFVESLNKNLGIDNSSSSQRFVTQLDSPKFEPVETEKERHRLFRVDDNTIFHFLDEKAETVKPTTDKVRSERKAPKDRKNTRNAVPGNKPGVGPTVVTRGMAVRQDTQTPSDNYFRGASVEKKTKPVLPNLKALCRSSNTKDSAPKRSTKSSKAKLEKDKVNESQQDVPSLLDPNGYTYKRWMQPTTSERSNFWLNKLNAAEEKRRSEMKIFDFSDDSITESHKSKKQRKSSAKAKGRKCSTKAISKKSNKANKTRRPQSSQRRREPLKQVKEILMNGDCQISNEMIEIKAKSRKLRDLLKSEEYPVTETKGKKSLECGNDRSSNKEPLKERFSRQSSQGDHNRMSLERSIYDEGGYNGGDRSFLDMFSRQFEVSFCKSVTNYKENSPPPPPQQEAVTINNREYDGIIRERSSSPDSDLFYNDSDNEVQVIEKEEDKVTKGLKQETADKQEIEVGESCDREVDISEIENLQVDVASPKRRKLTAEPFTELGDSLKLLPMFHVKVNVMDERNRQDTDNIIKTVDTATNRLINCIHRKNARDVVSYLSKAEEVTTALSNLDLSEKTLSMRKVQVFYGAKCSLNDVSVSEHVDAIRAALGDLNEQTEPSWRKVEKFNNRLRTEMENEIRDMVDREVNTYRHRMIQYTSIFNMGFDELFLK